MVGCICIATALAREYYGRNCLDLRWSTGSTRDSDEARAEESVVDDRLASLGLLDTHSVQAFIVQEGRSYRTIEQAYTQLASLAFPCSVLCP